MTKSGFLGTEINGFCPPPPFSHIWKRKVGGKEEEEESLSEMEFEVEGSRRGAGGVGGGAGKFFLFFFHHAHLAPLRTFPQKVKRIMWKRGGRKGQNF